MNRTILVVTIALSASLAGCLGAPAPSDAADPANATDDATNATERTLSGDSPGEHVHNLWKGRQKIALVDNSYEIEAFRANATGGGPLAQRVGPNSCQNSDILGVEIAAWCIGRVEFQPTSENPDMPKVVAPGTGKMSITVSWSDPTIDGIELMAVGADAESIPDWGGFEFGAPGQTHTFNTSYFEEEWEYPDNLSSFPLEVVDDGHATQSKWRFVAWAYSDTSFVRVADGSIDVQVDVHRAPGDLPIEPPHPDWWMGTDTYFVGYDDETANNAYQAWYISQDYTGVFMLPQNPIPPGTKEVVVQVNVTDDSASQIPDSHEVDFSYTTDGWWDWYAEPQWHSVEPAVEEDGMRIYRISVDERMTDSVYSCSGVNSTWRFRATVRPEDAASDDPVFGMDHPGAGHFAGQVEMSTLATRNAGTSWSDLDPDSPEDVRGCYQVRQAYT